MAQPRYCTSQSTFHASWVKSVKSPASGSVDPTPSSLSRRSSFNLCQEREKNSRGFFIAFRHGCILWSFPVMYNVLPPPPPSISQHRHSCCHLSLLLTRRRKNLSQHGINCRYRPHRQPGGQVHLPLRRRSDIGRCSSFYVAQGHEHPMGFG